MDLPLSGHVEPRAESDLASIAAGGDKLRMAGTDSSQRKMPVFWLEGDAPRATPSCVMGWLATQRLPCD